MLIAKNDEEKRSKLWRFVTTSTTIIIILIVVFFITKLFTSNPLEGTWRSEDNNMTLIIGSKDLKVKWDELSEESNVEVSMKYTIDKDAKTVTIKGDEKFRDSLGMLTTTFDYSVEQNGLILTEREYGEQMIFTKE